MIIYFVPLIVGSVIAGVGVMSIYNLFSESEDDNND